MNIHLSRHPRHGVARAFRWLLLILAAPAAAQGIYPEPEPLPALELRVTGTVHAIAAYGSGYVVGGQFDRVNGEPRRNIALLDAGGALADAGFAWIDAGTNGVVEKLAVAGDSVYVVGDFTQANGQPRRYVARFSLTDGSLDPGFAPQPDAPVRAVAVDGAGGVFLGGDFGAIDGVARDNSAKVDGDSGAVTSWIPDYRDASTVHAIAYDADSGLVYVGGNMRLRNGGLNRAVARLDGQTGAADPGWKLKVNPRGSPQVYAIALSATHVYLGGRFSRFDNINRANLARVDRGDGGVDLAWNPGANGAVRDIVVDGAEVVVGGEFTRIGGVDRQRLARVRDDGSVDPAFVVDPDRPVRALLADAGHLLVGGAFHAVNGHPAEGLARLDGSGTPDPAFSAFIAGPGQVDALALAADGSVFVGGVFDAVVEGGTAYPRSNLLRLAADHSLDTGWVADLASDVQALALDPANQRLYVGGSFGRGLVRFDLSAAPPVLESWDPAPDAAVTGLALDAGGRLYVRGQFSSIAGSARNGLARLSGASADGWNPAPDGRVDALALGDTAAWLGGDCVYVSGNECDAHLARVDLASGSRDGGFTVATDGAVSALLAADGALYLGGQFSTVQEIAHAGVARVDATTGAVDGWAPQVQGRVAALALDAVRGWLYAGGSFATAGGAAHPNMARASTSMPGVVDPGWRPGSDARLTAAVAVGTEGEVLVAGHFTRVTGLARGGLARLGSDGSDATAVAITGISPDSSQVGAPWTVTVALANLTDPATLPIGSLEVATDHGEGCSILSLDASGSGSCSITSATAGLRQVVATFTGAAPFLDAVSAPATHAVFADVAVGHVDTRIEALDALAAADGVDTAVVRITLVDGAGSPVAGVAVDFASSGSAVLAGGPWATDAAGQATATLTNGVAETVAVTGSFDADGDGSPDAPVVNGSPVQVAFFGPVDPGHLLSQIAATDGQAIADGSDTAAVRVSLVDANGTPVQGVVVAVSTSGSAVLAAADASTGADGAVVATFTDAVAEQVSVQASFDADADGIPDTPVENGSPALLDFLPDPNHPTATSAQVTAHLPDPSVVGQAYTVDVVVDATTPAAGTVLVSDGAGASCNAPVVAGSGSCTLASGSAGQHTLTASFAGAPGFGDSVSAGVAHTVLPAATQLALAASPALLGEGDSVGFTWTLAVVAPGAGSPDGMVTVSADGAPGCSAPVATGGCSVLLEDAGNFLFVASYPGSADFLASESPAVPVDVQAGGPLVGDVAVRHEIVRSGVLSDGSGDLVDYEFEVTNPGGADLAGVDLLLLLPAEFAPGETAWTCTGTGGGSCGQASGGGDVDFAAALPAGASVLVELSTRIVDLADAGVATAAEASTPEPELDPNNNSGTTFYRRCSGATLVEVGGITELPEHVCRFRDGFEARGTEP